MCHYITVTLIDRKKSSNSQRSSLIIYSPSSPDQTVLGIAVISFWWPIPKILVNPWLCFLPKHSIKNKPDGRQKIERIARPHIFGCGEHPNKKS